MLVSQIKQINAKIQEELNKIGTEFGVKIQLGNTRFGDTDYSTKIIVNQLVDGKLKLSAKDYEHIRLRTGLLTRKNFPTYDEVANKIIRNGSHDLRIVGFNPRKSTTPIILVDASGRDYSTSLNHFAQIFGLN